MKRSFIAIAVILILGFSGFALYKNFAGEKVEVLYPNGSLKQVIYMKDGKPDGIVKEYFESGVIKGEIEFTNGEQTGLAKFFYETGELRKRSRFRNGIETDTAFFYHKNGRLQQKSLFVEGKEEGVLNRFFSNGILDASGEKKGGKKVGNWNFYDSLGKWTRTIFYLGDTIQSVLEKGTYRNVLAGFRVSFPEELQKLIEVKGAASFSGLMNEVGAVTLSVGSTNLVKKTLSEQVDQEMKNAKETFPSFEVIKRKVINENAVLVDCRGKQIDKLNGEEFEGKFLFVRSGRTFMIASTYLSNKKPGGENKFRTMSKDILDRFEIIPPNIIIESGDQYPVSSLRTI
jgi:hypothetical protein